jgi:hypothetical protein
MKLVHEAIIKRGKIFETFRAGFFEPFKEKNLCSGVYLFQKLSQLSHGITTRWNTEDIVYEALHELLSDILAGKVAFGEFT